MAVKLEWTNVSSKSIKSVLSFSFPWGFGPKKQSDYGFMNDYNEG